jgi:alcohol dehydrogenase
MVERKFFTSTEFQVPTRVIFGESCIKDIGKIAKEYGDRAMIVTGKGSMKRIGVLESVQKRLEEARIYSIVYDEVIPNPTTELVDKGAEIARKENINLIIGLGGGSSLDSAKGIAVASTHGGRVWRYVSSGDPEHLSPTSKTLPIIAITSTSGTGSHTTPYAVITNPETQEKPAIRSDYIYPKVAFVDYDILKYMPPYLTAQTGMDVLAHSIESYVHTNGNSFTDIVSGEAIRLVGKYLRKAYGRGSDLDARSAMAWADTFAGVAISLAGTTIPHSLAHPISALYPKIAHGIALSVIHPTYLSYLEPVVPEKLADIANFLGKTYYYTTIREYAKQAREALIELQKDIKIYTSLKELGVKKEDIPRMARDAYKYMKSGFDNDPRTLTVEEAEEIYLASYEKGGV